MSKGTTREPHGEKGQPRKRLALLCFCTRKNGKRPGPREPGLFLAKGMGMEKER